MSRACFKGNAPPSLPATHNQIHTHRKMLPLHCQHSTEASVNHGELETVEEGTGGPEEIKRGAC